MNSAWVIFVLLAAIIASAASIVEKKTLRKQHAMEFSAILAIFAALITFPLWFIADINALSLTAIYFIYGAAFCSSIAFVFVAKALRHIAISVTSPFLVFGPLFTAIIAAIVLGERLTFVQGLGIAVLIIGAYTLESHGHQNLLEPLKHIFKSKYIRYIFIALLLYGVSAVLDKKILGTPADGGLGIPVLTYMPLVHFFLAINLIVMMLLFHDGFTGIGKGIKQNWKWVFVVAVLTVGYRLSQQYAVSLPGVLISLVIPIKRLSALFSTIIGGGLFHEENILRKSLACVVMIIGAVLIIL
ncbi:hypothetical protein AYK26_03550 [Euryarchaeota archaeon SM23-78]|nr:MAG: hypothetical protein AYK26_03550 [Euryarchaeota archaeon SM23-78]MBW3000553.1 DMT family transporter [Candidatus Woesearchaeota archaeon]